MRQTKVANRYAKALFTLAQESGKLDDVQRDMRMVRDLDHAEFHRMMVSPVINCDAKAKAFNAVFGGKIGQLSQAFFNLVFRKGRSISLADIGNAFEQMFNEHKGVVVAELTTAVPVSDTLKAELRTKLEALPHMKGKKVTLTEKIDASIIGGYVLQLEGWSLDASIKRDLQVIKTQFVENMYEQKLR
jgi:F-type H+-transporting ATPase subunit delta